MAFVAWSLASGSSGNCIWAEGENSALVIDAGLSASALLERLAILRRDPHKLKAVLLTHEHTDHASGAVPIARRFKVPILGTPGTIAAVLTDSPFVESEAHPSGSSFQVGEFWITSFRTEHDAADPVGYVLNLNGAKLCVVTDTGRITPTIRQAMRGCQLVILEANHDVAKLVRGPYPPPLKARILSDSGHLSNDDAAAEVAMLSRGDVPVCVWLAHLSAVNNTPRLALRSVQYALRSARPDNVRISVAQRDCISAYWNSKHNWWQTRLF
jgi:phosphoribosyl 1,2-cyclic phosphodiesterase